MALIRCPECGRENVSETAPRCPQCGFKIAAHLRKQNRKKPGPGVVLLALVVVIAVILLFVLLPSKGKKDGSPAASPTPVADRKADGILGAFSSQEESASEPQPSSEDQTADSILGALSHSSNAENGADSQDSASTLTLSASGYDENWNPVTTPLAGAAVTVDGVKTDLVTNADGTVTLTLKDSGTHIISASSDAQTIVPPVCSVVIEQTENPLPTTTIAAMIVLLVLFVLGLITFYFKRRRHTS